MQKMNARKLRHRSKIATAGSDLNFIPTGFFVRNTIFVYVYAVDYRSRGCLSHDRYQMSKHLQKNEKNQHRNTPTGPKFDVKMDHCQKTPVA